MLLQKYTSFTRKLNRWGFTRVTRGPETGAYYHKYFQRGDTRLCMQMSCQSGKNLNNQQGGYPPFGKGGYAPGDLQNQHLIRQQMQQLQLHQFHLQQMQMQQQQMHAAELFRQQQQQANKGESGDDGKEKDGKSDDKSAEGGASAAPPAAPMLGADNPYLQSLQQAGVAPPMGLLPVLQAGAFAGGLPPGAVMQPQGAVVAPPAGDAPPGEAVKAEAMDAPTNATEI